MTSAPSEAPRLTIVGGGLAGCEAAWQAAERGVRVTLIEMRPNTSTPAHTTDKLAELVCSNSLGSNLPDRAGGLLKSELRRLGSFMLAVADDTAVPAGGALAVDREAFSVEVTERLGLHPNVELVRQEVTAVPEGTAVIATGPLTSDNLANEIEALTGTGRLHFYDALAPIVAYDSVDMTVAFRQSRYDRGESNDGDYLNCPLSEQEFQAFVKALLDADRIELREFEKQDERFFEGCLPIEVIASRGPQALSFGPMRPVGLTDPRSGRRPYAVVQLRQDDAAGSLYNLVGFQTNLKWPEQRRVLRMIPGLTDAEFVRLGQMHRNTFLNSPTLLDETHMLKARAGLFFAGQLTGIEGYTGNIASGLVAGVNAARHVSGLEEWRLPHTTMIGALCRYITEAEAKLFQPMKANFGLLPPLVPPVKGKRNRQQAYARRAMEELDEHGLPSDLNHLRSSTNSDRDEA